MKQSLETKWDTDNEKMNQIYIGQKLCEGNENVNELDNFIIFSTRTHNSVKKNFKKNSINNLGLILTNIDSRYTW